VIISAIKKIFATDDSKIAGHTAYVTLVEKARNPFFYSDCGVPDTLDGRFDVIVLHIFMLTHQLKNQNPKLIRSVWEAFFSDMDRSLREMGASDTGIGKRIKKMAQAFYGRIAAYEKAIDTKQELMEAMKRNLYRDNEVSSAQLEKIADYAINTQLDSPQ